MTAFHRPSGAGATYPFLATTMEVKAGGADTDGVVTVIECECPPGFAPPLHVHHSDDEAFYVVSGGMRVSCGDDTWDAAAGSFVFLPRELPHAFAVLGDEPLRLLQLTWPAGFERFAAEVSTAPSGPPDFGLLAAAAARHGYEILGPPPNL